MNAENLQWILSFYRTSEISGALFFGELAQRLRPSAVQRDMTRHFADEACHAGYWTDCLAALGLEPLRLGSAYQDSYLDAAGLPANLMEVLAITQVFEQRVVAQYTLHAKTADMPEPVQNTLARILEDERWHVEWVREALNELRDDYGADRIAATLARYRDADRRVYRRLLDEHRDRLQALRTAHR